MTSLVPRQRLVIIYGPLLHYRIDLFNALCDRYDVTVFTTGFSGPHQGLRFEVVVVEPLRIGPFSMQRGLRALLRQGHFDVCISFVDVAHLDSLAAVFLPVAKRTFCWGVWLTDTGVANSLRLAAIKRCEAALFYSHKHLEEVGARGVDPRKLFVAQNTVAVANAVPHAEIQKRDSVLFVGSLAARKGLDRLVRLFASIVPSLPIQTKLVIVGDGPERTALQALVTSLGILDRVEMPGRINNPEALAAFYARALVSVSLSQAGLSVLQSMGFGVPFLTLKGSVSGGETLNITHGENGFIVADDDEEVAKVLIGCASDPDRQAAMGAAAREHYQQYATVENYAQGFFDMLEGTRIARIWKGQSISESEIIAKHATKASKAWV